MLLIHRVARDRELAVRLRLQLQMERGARIIVEREFRKLRNAIGMDFGDGNVDSALNAHEKRLRVVMPRIWTSSAQMTGRRLLNEARGDGLIPETKKGPTLEQRLNAGIADWIARYGRRRFLDVSEETGRSIRSIIADGRRANWTLNEIASAIEDASGLSSARAETIARTETHSASSMGSDEAARSLGIPLLREWMSAEDDRTRSAHAAANGQQVGMDTPFEFFDPDSGSQYRLMRPGDPSGPPEGVINCRCVVGYVPQDRGESE